MSYEDKTVSVKVAAPPSTGREAAAWVVDLVTQLAAAAGRRADEFDHINDITDPVQVSRCHHRAGSRVDNGAGPGEYGSFAGADAARRAFFLLRDACRRERRTGDAQWHRVARAVEPWHFNVAPATGPALVVEVASRVAP